MLKPSFIKSRNFKFKACFFLALLFLVFETAFLRLSAGEENKWELLYQPRQRTVRSVVAVNDLIFIGTGNGVLLSRDNGKSWEDFGTDKLQKDGSGNSLVKWIYLSKEEKKIYIATSLGAYYSDIKNPDWKIFFRNTKTESGEINSLAVEKDTVYLATNDGVWVCNLRDKQCSRLNNGLEADTLTGNHLVLNILIAGNNLYSGTSHGVYKYSSEKLSWERKSKGIQELSDGKNNVSFLYSDEENNLWAACGTGIYLSKNSADFWEKISDGLKDKEDGFQESFYISEFSGMLFSATATGVYFLDNKNVWNILGSGIRTNNSSKNVYWLSKNKDELFSATDEGLFVLSIENKEKFNPSEKIVLKGKIINDFASLDEIEPKVVEVQREALKFAALPTKNDFNKYKIQARLRNLVPRVGFDTNSTGTSTDYLELGMGISTDILSASDFNSDKTSRYQKDGRTFKQLSVSWNTNELIYDDEIREILNQARLTANIKENLLDDVTRIYYQRKNLQLNNLISPAYNNSSRLKQEIEVAELTGQLDSRTGGWFSQEIEKRKQKIAKNEKKN